jgi:hypothetical protein
MIKISEVRCKVANSAIFWIRPDSGWVLGFRRTAYGIGEPVEAGAEMRRRFHESFNRRVRVGLPACLPACLPAHNKRPSRRYMLCMYVRSYPASSHASFRHRGEKYRRNISLNDMIFITQKLVLLFVKLNRPK